MPLDPLAKGRFTDIRDHAMDAMRYAAPVDEAAFIQDDMRCRAVERCLEIIGEAARAMPVAVKTAHPAIPWPIMVGMRNILTHEYGRVNRGLVFRTVVEDLPVLVRQVEGLLAADRDGTGLPGP